MKSFAMIGAGAVGSYYGARLAEAGNDVRFLLRADYEEVQKNGLVIESIHDDFSLSKVSCAESPEALGKVDVVIVAWKTTANAHLKEIITPLLHDNSVILTLQNGLGNVEALSEIFGSSRVLGALCFVCINRLKPGLIAHTGGGKVAMGELTPGITPRLEELVTIFQNSKIECVAAHDLGEAQWRKLVWNIPFNGLCITEGGLDTQELLSRKGGEKKVRSLMAEVLLAATALGYEIEESFIEYQLKITRPMGAYRPSSMIDYLEDREVEIDSIWGEPLRRAMAAGAKVPLIEALCESLKSKIEARPR